MNKKANMGGVGMPTVLYLQEFGELINDVFGGFPYLVGSATQKKSGFRDVDIRVILTDEEYEAWGFGDPDRPQQNRKWRSLVKAYSLLGQKMTGLPIDFQIQQMTEANKNNKGYRWVMFDLSKIQDSRA